MTSVTRAARTGTCSFLVSLAVSGSFLLVGDAASTWTPRAAMSPARYAHAAAVLNGRIHIVGGVSSPSCTFLASHDVYDPSSDTWTASTEAPMSVGRVHPRLVALGGFLYVMGGASGCGVDLKSAQRYDPGTNAWTPLPDMASPRIGFGAAAAAGRIFAIGGVFPSGSGGFLNLVESYDPATNAWTSEPSLPQAFSEGAFGVINGIIYVAGGRTDGGASSLQTYAFDPLNSGAGWVTKATMPAGSGRIGIGSAVSGGKLYAIGGSGAGLQSRVDIYDPITNSWSLGTPLPSPRTELAGASVDEQIYALGGFGAAALTENLLLRTPPITTATSTPAPNGNGWNNGNVTVALNATVAPGASVASITYALSGAQSGGATVGGGSAPVVISAEGTTVVTFHATDSLGNVEADQSITVRIDKTPPVITAIPDHTVIASTPAGADVFFTPTATDSGSGVVSVTAAPSGPHFPMGDTVVTLNALDAAGNGAVPSTFVVHVVPPLHTVFVVNSAADLVDAAPGNGFCAASTGECTLRAAVQEANAQPGGDTILIPALTITLQIAGADEDAAARGDLDVTDTNGVLAITGSGAANTLIQACDPVSNPSCAGIDRIFDIQDAAALAVEGMTLRRGQATAEGGAIRVGVHAPWDGGPGDASKLTMSNSVLSDNSATKAGGAVGGLGAMTITGSTLTRNRSINNHGGAIFANQGARLTVRNSTVSDNAAVSVADPVAGGAIFANNGTLKSVTVLEGSTFSGNTASTGGAVYMTTGATLSAWNTTFSGNTATIRGGAIGIDGPAQLASVTLYGNGAPTGGAVYVHGGSLTMRSSVIARSTTANCAGLPVVSGGYNLSDDATCALASSGDIVGADAQLAPLANYGGPTETHRPFATSPLVDAGDPAECTDTTGTPLATDQRGAGFPRAVDGNGDGVVRCDIGAVEDAVGYPNRAPTVSAGGPYAVDEGSSVTLSATGSDPDGDAVTYSWDLDNDGAFETPGQSVTFSAAAVDGPAGRPVRVRATDGTLSAEASTTVNVWNVVPSVVVNPGASVQDGQLFTTTGSFTDPGPDEWTATVDYGDGSGIQALALNPDKTFALAHVYANDGVFTISVDVRDDDGGGTVGTVLAAITPSNKPPTVSTDGPYIVNEGGAVTLNAFGSDPDGDSLSYSWDLDNDGSFETPGQSVVFSAAAIDGPTGRQVRVRASDGRAHAETSTMINVSNVVPTIAPLAGGTIVEDTAFVGSGGFTDPGPDTWTVTIDYGDGTVSTFPASGQSFPLNHVYPDPGTYLLRVTVADDDGGDTNRTANIMVTSRNRPPSVSAGGPYTVTEGSSIVLTAFGSDPNGDPVSYIWDLDNDGSFETPGAAVSFSAAGLDGPSTRSVAVLATDPEGATATAFTVVSVNNAAPVVGAITAPVAPQSIGSSISASAPFSDPGIPDTFTCSIEWGDDTTTGGAVGGTGCSGSHVYTAAGVYSIHMTVRDDDGGTGSSTFNYVVIYSGTSFVTGGGWLGSPAGAFAENPSATGRANFGFNAKYVNGQAQGSTEFVFQNGGLNFHSTSYDWIVVSGFEALYVGSGTLNGSGDYAFLVSVADGKLAGTDVDRFRIRIWEKATGAVVYDDQPGDDPYASAAVATSAGSIRIR